MTQCVAWYEKYVELQAQHFNGIIVIERHVSPRNVLKCRAPDLGVSVLSKWQNPADMVGVVVGDQNVTEDPARMLDQPVHNRCGVARIDHGATLIRCVL